MKFKKGDRVRYDMLDYITPYGDRLRGTGTIISNLGQWAGYRQFRISTDDGTTDGDFCAKGIWACDDEVAPLNVRSYDPPKSGRLMT